MSTRLETIKSLFKIINIDINNIEDLMSLEIDRDKLLTNKVNEECEKLVEKCKLHYNSSKLTSLHKNRLEKQKFPVINLFRQILKCHDLKLQPKVTSIGYHKNGKKIIKRSFQIKNSKSQV